MRERIVDALLDRGPLRLAGLDLLLHGLDAPADVDHFTPLLRVVLALKREGAVWWTDDPENPLVGLVGLHPVPERP